LSLKTSVIGRYGKLFTYIHPIESAEVKMEEKVQLKGGIYEPNFGYNAKMEGYTNLSSDILKLYAIGLWATQNLICG